jgi:hypothetical protein
MGRGARQGLAAITKSNRDFGGVRGRALRSVAPSLVCPSVKRAGRFSPHPLRQPGDAGDHHHNANDDEKSSDDSGAVLLDPGSELA